MSRSSLLTFALAAVSLAVSVPVVAGGGGGGGTKGGSIPVRIKNVGVAPVAVNAVSGNASLEALAAGARTVAANGVSQFGVKKGGFTAVAANPDNPLVVNKVRNFDTRNFKTIYLWAEASTTAATLVGAPGGVKF